MSSLTVASIIGLTELSLASLQSTSEDTPPVVEDVNGVEVGQFCRAWACINASAGTLRDSFNVSSIVDNGTGDFTINFDNPLPNANYAVAGSQDDGTSGAAMGPMVDTTTPQTVSLVRVQFSSGNGTAIDSAYAMAVVFGA